MKMQPYEIDPEWPSVVRPELSELDDSEMPDCEVCWARIGTKLVDLFGVEGWACDYCR
jgi:hypothetical protein